MVIKTSIGKSINRIANNTNPIKPVQKAHKIGDAIHDVPLYQPVLKNGKKTLVKVIETKGQFIDKLV